MFIFSTYEKPPNVTADSRSSKPRRLRAFVLLLRYSGIRIGDVTTCSTDKIDGNRLFLYAQKTGTPVRCVPPDFVIKALGASPRSSARYFFWTGEGNPLTAVGKWQVSLRRLFELAAVPKGHAHRFRITFAVELLKAGVPIERVPILLGIRGAHHRTALQLQGSRKTEAT